MMSSIATELAELLGTIRRPGDFFAAGITEFLAPRLEVEGVGPVALPLLPMQAEQLVAVAERAPHGRGADTIVDTTVRRTWQIAADRVRIAGKHWERTLQAVVARVAEGLGVGEPIAAELYKLLVYDQGSFFTSHRDTEKSPRMFGTLVLALPSTSTGGELVIRHKGREARLDLYCEDPSEMAFAPFFADCVHEVLPVATGCRLVLVYNLLRRGHGPMPRPPSYESEQARVAALLQAWAAGTQSPDDDAPEKLIYPLEHAYTPAELGFDALKGADAAVAGVLVAAAPQAGCDLHLALISVEESGFAEYADNYRSRRGSDDDEFEAGEVDDRLVTLAEWRRPDRSPSPLGELPVEEAELSPPDALEDMEPDEEHFQEATGNAGASFERTYSRAALVLWPRARIFAVLNQAGLPVTLPYLADLTERWIAAGEDRQSPLLHQVHELAAHMVSRWPTQDWYPRQDKSASETARMLALLTRIEDRELIDALMAAIAAGGRCDTADNAAIIGTLGLFSPDRAAALVQRIIVGTSAKSLSASGNLLAGAVAALPPGRQAELAGAAAALVEALPGDPSRTPPHDPWQRQSGVQPGLIVDLFAALASVGGSLSERAADHMLAWPGTYGLDAVLVPAVRQLTASDTIKGTAAAQRLRAACVQHLQTRIAEPLEAPKDWSRASALGCRCPDCSELARYLGDPERKTWVFKAAAPARGHVEDTIRKAHCDVDVTTDCRGRPYSLVCAKNQASYDRRVKQRRKDLADLDALAG
jgi:hypothetical protein